MMNPEAAELEADRPAELVPERPSLRPYVPDDATPQATFTAAQVQAAVEAALATLTSP